MTHDELLRHAQTCQRNGQLQEAEALYRQLVAADPNYHPAWQALGLLAFSVGKLPVAAQCFEAAIAGNPKVALYHRNVGELYRRLGQLDKAVAAGRRAVKLAPDDLDAHYNLGLALFDAKDLAQAVQLYRKALRIDPQHGLSWNNLGSALEQQGDKDAAQDAYSRAIAIDPKHAEAQNNLGAILSERGRADDARACFEAAIAANPTFVEAHFNLSSLKTYTRADPHFATLEQLHAQRAQMNDHARIRYDFAFGKALDDIGEHDRAFAAFAEGNQLQHACMPIDETAADRLLAQIVERFDAGFFAQRREWRGADDPRRTPIFIVGMPRSGTTLLEQILCSHASVFGAGELASLNRIVQDSAGAFPGNIANMTEAQLRGLGEKYLDEVWKLAPDSAFITDKMPANFFHIGLIHLALPHAKIIHAMRDPMDSCFSCYTRLFNETMEFAYDQGSLGRYYRRYRELMAHWHTVLPAGTLLDLPYEELVDDTEAQARRILDFVGLPWDDNVLQFHRNDRLVKTASALQVRTPIYTTSVARWKHYARHLQPLYELVRDLRPVDDAPAILAQPQHDPGALHQAGIEAYREGRFDDAMANFDRILALQPDMPEVLNSKGFALQDRGEVEAARACFERAVQLAPDLAMARMNLAFAQLKTGEWEQGWENYEVRWTGSAEASRQQFGRPACPLPQWNGETGTANQSIVVIIEQGFGDTFQFSRYIALLTERFAKVGFACSEPVLRLMDWSFGDRVVLLSKMPAQFDGWDWQCPMMSLPRAFRTRPGNIPRNVPYLRAAEPARNHWAQRLERAAKGRMRVGIAWAGRPAYQYDARRSLSFAKLLPLLRGAGVSWVSLQKWRPDDVPAVMPAGVHWLDWTEELADFADTAALVANLDLVVSIDSALVHLAGALDRPVWMLDRFDNEWRWFHNRLDSPWYPRLRIFRQQRFGEWAAPIAALLAELPAADTNDTVLAATPADIQNLHAQGIAEYRAGRVDAAIQLLIEATARGGDSPALHSDLGEMCRQRGRMDEAVAYGERAIVLGPNLPAAHSNLGIALFDSGDLARAEACQRRALELAPQFVPALNNLGSICRERGDLVAALAWYDKALAAAPDHVEALNNRGAVLTENGRAAEGLISLQRALELAPKAIETHCNLGLAYQALHRHDEAQALLQQVLQVQPNSFYALLGMAAIHLENDRNEEAESLARRAVQTAPNKAPGYLKRGLALAALGRGAEAKIALDRALELDPNDMDALVAQAHLHMEQGHRDEGRACLERALARDPDHVGARFHLAQSGKVDADDSNFAALCRLESARAEGRPLKDDEAISLDFALGKCLDDTGRYAEAFAHYLDGNRRRRATLHYDAAASARRFEAIRTVFTREKLRQLTPPRGASASTSVQPIFVLGMPRSGTTLTEQILASHPDVYGAGELRDLLAIVQQPAGASIAGTAPPPYPDNLAAATPQTVAAWGAEYMSRLQRHAPAARFIVDKMPANFHALGLIPSMLPHARIIHVRRDPLDTCLSNFVQLFNTKQEHSYDLTELGRYYADYEKLMAHWRDVLPAGSFIEVRYEDIVADLEGQARRLLDYCGLAWSDACLDFHRNERDIRTASLAQVRQPLYANSVGRWRHYEQFLEPLRAALES